MARYIFPTVVIPTTHAPFGGETGEFDIALATGVDWSGAAWAAKIALTQGGTTLIPLASAAAGSEGISAVWDATLQTAAGTVVGGTVVTLQIDEATLEGLDWGATPSDEPLNLYLDLLVTPVGGAQRYVCEMPVQIWKGIAD